MTEETKQKISKANKGRKPSKEVIEKRRIGMINSYRKNPVRRKRMSEMVKQTGFNKCRIGKKHSEETKLKISIGNTGKVYSEETKRKIGDKKKGKPFSGISFSWKGITGERHPQWKGGISKDWKHYARKRRNLLESIEGHHTTQEWKELKKKYNYICLCCKRFEPEIKLTEDHIIPASKEGTDYISNIQPLCQSCNSTKHTKTIDYRSELISLLISSK